MLKLHEFIQLLLFLNRTNDIEDLDVGLVSFDGVGVFRELINDTLHLFETGGIRGMFFAEFGHIIVGDVVSEVIVDLIEHLVDVHVFVFYPDGVVSADGLG